MDKNIKNFKKTKYACFYTYLAMASVFCLPPMLFVTFHDTYKVSYTLLGTLVLINFCSQLIIDLIFTFFNKHFNIRTVLRLMPLLTSTGLTTYAVVPALLPKYAYAGLVAGTVIFSVASGLCEVLLSPIIAALPSDNPERDMSTLHSLYAYGVVGAVIISTAFLKLFGTENWMYLTLFFAALPLISFASFLVSPLPDLKLSNDNTAKFPKAKLKFLTLCALCIFLGSAAENIMTNWISGYIERAVGIPKATGDILGLALFAVLLGLGRTLYAKYGKKITAVLLCGMAGSVVCYLAAGISSVPVISVIACVLTGLCTSMLWPGTLIMMEEKIPNPGVAAYALMAASGDFGASVAPQLVGAIADKVMLSDWAERLSGRLSLSLEQIGMKTAMLTGVIFPLLGTVLLLYITLLNKRIKN